MNSAADIERWLARVEELTRMGMVEAAELACREVVGRAPGEHRGWAWLGMLALIGNRCGEAERALRQALALCPQDAYHWANLGLALRGLGRSADAAQALQQALAIDASSAGHWAALGNCLSDLHRWQEAAEVYRQALARDANDAETWTSLGAAEHALGRLDEAQQAYERSLSLAPGGLHAATRYALLQSQRGNPGRGIELIERVLARAPQLVPAWLVLGNSLRLLDRLPAAEAAYRQAVGIEPTSRDARYNLALTLVQRLDYCEAETLARQLVMENAADHDAWMVLGGALQAQGRADEALDALRRAVAQVASPTLHSKLLVALHYADAVDPAGLLAAHREWDAAYAQRLRPAAPAAVGAIAGSRPLRIGFSAIDFAASPTGYLGLRAIECLDRSQCSVICYSDRLREDELTARFRAAAQTWRTTIGLTDEELAQQVRRDEIDVLVDLGGHVGRRLLLLARQPAPLQITWLGYVGTTGLSAMHGLVADQYHVRPGEEAHYAETVLRMPHDYICYGPPERSPDVNELPALAAGYVTFGSFNNPAKFSPSALAAWSAILRRVPGSKLLLKYGGLDQPQLRARVVAAFQERGIAAERIVVEGWAENYELLASYNRLDLALDTQPYSGGVTTCEALWMGVPVITCPGMAFASRHSTSHLTNAGYPQFVARDLNEYVGLAASWATRLNELAALRRQMREQVRTSPLCDGPRFARDLLALIQGEWKRRFPGRAGTGG